MRRLALRRLRADDGLSLVETVVALLVFSLFMTGLAASMTMFAHTSAVNKARSIAVNLAQKYVEEARAKGSADLELCPGTTPAPPTQANFNNTLMFTAIAPATTATCMTYQKTKTLGSYSFNVTELVFNGPSGITSSGQPQTEKFFDVVLTWSAPVSGRYETSTSIDNNVAPVNQQVTGISFDMQDENGSKLGTATVTWYFEVRDNSTGLPVANCGTCTGNTEENGQPLVTVPAGDYTCFLDNTNSQGWVPSTTKNPGTYTIDSAAGQITWPCHVTQGQTLDAITYWAPVGSCTKLAAAKNTTFDVYVTDSQQNPISTGSVTITEANTSPVVTKTLAASTAGANGTFYAKFTNITADWWYYTVSAPGYQTSDNLGPACVLQNKLTNQTASLQSTTNCSTAGTAGTVAVHVQSSPTVPINGAQVVFLNQTTGAIVKFGHTTNASGDATNTVAPGYYVYMASDNGAHDGTGPLGAVCVPADPGSGNAASYTVTMNAAGTDGCATTGTNSTLNVQVTDQAGAGINGIPVYLFNGDSVGTAPTSHNTTTSGSVVGFAGFGSHTPDEWYIFANDPAGTEDLNYFTNAMMVCLLPGGVTQQFPIKLTGNMTVQVSVDNESTPIRTYQVVITDGTAQHNQYVQGLTVLSGSSNIKTATFNFLPTGTGYTVAVYFTDSNGQPTSVLWSNNYDTFTGVGQTYQASGIPDTTGDGHA